MRKEIFLAIVAKLSQALDDQEQPIFKHFDLWNQQIEFIEQEAMFDMPAVFVEFGKITWRNLSGGSQEASCNVILHVITPWSSSAASGSPFQSDALALFDLLDLINKELNGLQGGPTNRYFCSMRRVESDTNHNHEDICESLETFSVRIFEQI